MSSTNTRRYTGYARVAVDSAVNKLLDYGIPPELADQITPGVLLEVTLRGRKCQGVAVEVVDSCEFPNVQPVRRVITDHRLVTDELFQLAQWMTRYYCAPLRSVLRAMVPATVRKENKAKQQLYVRRGRGRKELQERCAELRLKQPRQAAVLDLVLEAREGVFLTEILERLGCSRSPVDSLAKRGDLRLDTVDVARSPLDDAEFLKTAPKRLTDEQQVALDTINNSLDGKEFCPYLLHGVTGSGKTEVYLQAIDRCIAGGRGVIMLVPEIALTTQTIERFRSRFENHIAVLHHRLSDGERFDEWHRIRRGEAPIVIGARSAVFSPMPGLGLVIVDEEHESSYKQNEEAPCYHARDIAVMRAKLCHGVAILGSATPSMESYHNARNGKYRLLTLKYRADNAQIPQVTVVDMREEDKKAKRMTTFSEQLLDAIKKRWEAGEQSILFLNRRGYHTTLLCHDCQHPVSCPRCDVTLSYHRSQNVISCHLCGYVLSPPPRHCEACGGETMKFRGVGTEQVERALHAIFPEIRTLRVDADTTRHKGSHQKLLRTFRTGKADVMIGTQMIAKGLHFPEVTLVGVLNSDATLNIPDFRASEQVYQLLTQVAGRAGRGVLPGEVIIQSRMPDNDIIRLACQQDYEAFYDHEAAVREMFAYPPFCRLVKVRFSGPDEGATSKLAERFRRDLVDALGQSYIVHPVLPAGYARVKDNFLFQFLVRGRGVYGACDALARLRRVFPLPKKVRLHIDVDPIATYF